ncbi:hypothetical protein GN956_G26066 [Arapaima gigas]
MNGDDTSLSCDTGHTAVSSPQTLRRLSDPPTNSAGPGLSGEGNLAFSREKLHVGSRLKSHSALLRESAAFGKRRLTRSGRVFVTFAFISTDHS